MGYIEKIRTERLFLPDLYELEDENGNKQTFELLDAMEYGDEKYYALTPYYENGDEALEDSGNVVILKAEYDENNDEILASIEDDDEYEKIDGHSIYPTLGTLQFSRRAGSSDT